MRVPGQARFFQLQRRPAMAFVKRDRRKIGFRIERSGIHGLSHFYYRVFPIHSGSTQGELASYDVKPALTMQPQK
jgi:hypothetical protein